MSDMFSYDPWDYGKPGWFYFKEFDDKHPFTETTQLSEKKILETADNCSHNNEYYPEELKITEKAPPLKRRKIEPKKSEQIIIDEGCSQGIIDLTNLEEQ